MRGATGTLDALDVLDTDFFWEYTWTYKCLLGAHVRVGKSAERSAPDVYYIYGHPNKGAEGFTPDAYYIYFRLNKSVQGSAPDVYYVCPRLNKVCAVGVSRIYLALNGVLLCILLLYDLIIAIYIE